MPSTSNKSRSEAKFKTRGFRPGREPVGVTVPAHQQPATLIVRRRMGVPQRVFARLMSVSDRSLSKLERGEPVGESARRQLTEIARLQEALAKVMDARAVGHWLQQPNPAFDGLKPLEVIERGEIDRIWAMVYQLESGTAG
jgi:hypothetical protein